MEKHKPHYDLATIQNAFADITKFNRTYSSKQGADDLGMDDADVIGVIQGLKRTDFDKSMTSIADYQVWQDVYKPVVSDKTLYVKFTLDAQKQFLLISFKEA
jgi:motility quorum-sensing regulator / GCU-specific mRNA interferase toxin